MEINLVNDLSTLTTIPEKYLSKINNKIVLCLNDYVEEAILKNEEDVVVDIGFGKLVMLVTDTSIKYKFIPNDYLEKSLLNTILNRHNLLENTLEDSLSAKITEVYKEFL